MTGFEQAVFWGVIFAIVFPSYLFIKNRLTKTSVGKPTQDEQDASSGTL